MNRFAGRLDGLLLVSTITAMPVALWAALLYAPMEQTMGAVQRIFYFHVPAAVVAYLAVAILLGSSIPASTMPSFAPPCHSAPTLPCCRCRAPRS